MAIITCGHGDLCNTERKNSGQGCGNPVTKFAGAVLATWEANGYDDSDFLAYVWDSEKGSTRVVEYASTRGWTYHNHAEVDATPEVIELALAEYRAAWLARELYAADVERFQPTKGRIVRSTTKRGKNVGVEGEVKWVGIDAYRSDRWVTFYRVGVKVAGESKLRYLAADKAEVVNPAEVDTAEITERSKTTKPANWHSASYAALSLPADIREGVLTGYGR